jgi:hypothetical protein
MASKNTFSPVNIIVGLVIVSALVGGAVYIINANNAPGTKTAAGQVAGVTTQNTTETKNANNPKAILNKTYAVNALDVTGKPAKSKVDLTIKTAEKSQDILIKAQPATAKNGSSFFVLQVELKNPTAERLIVSPLDLIRLMVDNQKRAAEIYSEEVPNIRGSVVIEPDSTKVTRVGFVLTPDIVSKKLKLQIGEINSPDKQVIDVKI